MWAQVKGFLAYVASLLPGIWGAALGAGDVVSLVVVFVPGIPHQARWVVLVFFLGSLVVAYRYDTRRQLEIDRLRECIKLFHDEATAFRTALFLEIRQNRSRFAEQWDKLSTKVALRESQFSGSDQLILSPDIECDEHVWGNRNPQRPMGMTEGEVREVQEFYGHLRALAGIQSALRGLRREQREQRALHSQMGVSPPDVYAADAPGLWEEAQGKARAILDTGNCLEA